MITDDPNEFAERVAEMRMVAHELNSRILRLLEESKPDDLATMIDLLRLISQSDQGASLLHYWLGNMNAIMRLKHNRCVCGDDHDKEILVSAEARKAQDEARIARRLEEENSKPEMREYNLLLGTDGKLLCGGCGMRYLSLDDRMLRKPGTEGCAGCQQKAKWG